MSEGKKLPQYVAAVCICIGALGAGTILGWTANITTELKKGKLNKLDIKDDFTLGWVGSTMTIGAMLMCFPIGFIADWIGRKPTVLLTVIPFTIGWVLIITAKHIAMVYVGRLLTGIAGGSFCVTAPLYTTEISQTEIRGRLGTFFQLFITIGILYAYFFGWACSLLIYNILCLIVPLVFGVLFFFQPETPVYDIKKGKIEKAEKSFKRLRGEDYDYSSEMKAIQDDIEEDKKLENFWEALKTKAAKKATLICFMLMFYQQLSGINAVIFYSKEIFIDAGSTIPEHWCVIIIGIVQVIATVLSSWLIEKTGRKLLLMLSCGLMGLSTLILGIYFSLKNHKVIDEKTAKTIGFIPILSLIIFISAFSLGLGPIPWLASSEIFPVAVKTKCSSAAATFNWFLAFMVTLFYPKLSKAIGNDITFYIFTVISFSGIFFVKIVMPETKGKPLSEIQAEISK